MHPLQIVRNHPSRTHGLEWSYLDCFWLGSFWLCLVRTWRCYQFRRGLWGGWRICPIRCLIQWGLTRGYRGLLVINHPGPHAWLLGDDWSSLYLKGCWGKRRFRHAGIRFYLRWEQLGGANRRACWSSWKQSLHFQGLPLSSRHTRLWSRSLCWSDYPSDFHGWDGLVQGRCTSGPARDRWSPGSDCHDQQNHLERCNRSFICLSSFHSREECHRVRRSSSDQWIGRGYLRRSWGEAWLVGSWADWRWFPPPGCTVR